MIQKLKMKLAILSATLMMPFGLALAAPVTVLADHTTLHKGLCTGANLKTSSVQGGGCTDALDTGGFQKTLESIVNIISILVGVVAVLMIIFGGFKYITSGGDATKVTAAKNTILYGLIGLIIVALAQIIVKFVLNQVTTSTTP